MITELKQLSQIIHFFPSIKSFVNVFETRFFTYDDTLFHLTSRYN